MRDVLCEGSQHAWSLDELLDKVRHDIGSADYSTVFRAVAFLEEQGEVRKVEVGDGRSRWEPALAHHDHLLCTDCGRVAELEGACPLDGSSQGLGDTSGFRISGHELVFTGVCPDCQAR